MKNMWKAADDKVIVEAKVNAVMEGALEAMSCECPHCWDAFKLGVRTGLRAIGPETDP